jgi:hypothetical protein
MRTTTLRTLSLPLSILLAGSTLLAGCGRDENDQLASGAPYGTQGEALRSEYPAPLSTDSYGLAEQVPPVPDRVVIQESPDAQSARLAERERDVARREAAVRESELARREAALAARERRQDREAAAPRSEAPIASSEEREERPARRAVPVTVPAGTALEVELLETVSSATSQPGDSVSARVSGSVYEDGVAAIPAGSRVRGVVSDAQGLRRVGGQARLAVEFNELVLPSGESVPIQAAYSQVGKSESGKDAATIGGGAAVGGILGHKIKGNRRGTVVGAILGAAAGTAIASKTKGQEVTLPSGTVLTLSLQDSVTVRR